MLIINYLRNKYYYFFSKIRLQNTKKNLIQVALLYCHQFKMMPT